MITNRTWLAFANETICNHRKAVKELGFVSWTTNIKSKFAEGDIVYLFMNDDRSVRFKLRVTKVNFQEKMEIIGMVMLRMTQHIVWN